MSKKTTISLSEELHKEMQFHKTSINFSKLFAKAFKKEVARLKLESEFEAGIPAEVDIKSLIKRLKEEKRSSDTQEAEKAAIVWASTEADYFELTTDERKEAACEVSFEESEFKSYEIWVEGWKKGIKIIWDQVKDHI